MNKVFVDSDVVIDLLIDRKPYAHFSAILFDLITRNTKDYGKAHLPIFTPEAY